MPTIHHGKIAMECQHHNLYLYPENPKLPPQCFDELRALLQCFAHMHYGLGGEEHVFDLFLNQRPTSFGHFFLEFEAIIGSGLAIKNTKRIHDLEKELTAERVWCRKAQSVATKASKRAGQVAPAVLMMAEEEVEDGDEEVFRDLTTDAQLALIHEFADYSH